jgi:uncharacterized protein with GYD domain
MYQLAYTGESIAAQVREPQDRLEVVEPALDRVGAKILAAGYSFGEYDCVAICEAPNDIAMAAVALAFAAGGAVRAARTTKLLSGQEWISALTQAQDVAPQYRPAR